jgi:hypothetical protein
VHSSTIFENSKYVYRSDRNLHGGGVLIAITDQLRHFKINIAMDDSTLEFICVYIEFDKVKSNNCVLVCIYNPPSNNVAPGLAFLLDKLRHLYHEEYIVLVGDFNMPDINWQDLSVGALSHHKNWHSSFLDIVNEFGLTQLIQEATHVKGNILDLVFCSKPHVISQTGVIDPGLSDHFLVEFKIRADIHEKTHEIREILLYHKANAVAIGHDLGMIENSIIQQIAIDVPVDEVWKTYKVGLRQTIANNVPVKKVKIGGKEPVWFNSKAKSLVRKQRRYYNSYKKTGRPDLLMIYKDLRRKNKKIFRQMELNYTNQKLYEPMRDGNTKPFYRYMKKQTAVPSGVQEISENGTSINSCHGIVSALNKYFKSVFNELDAKVVLEDTRERYMQIGQTGVAKLIKDLKNGKAPGPDGIRKEDLTVNIEANSAILTLIFQYSLDKRKVPSDWKMANVVPVFKGGDKKLPSNYRPISLTSICCKLLERIILSHISEKLNKILHNHQHGFRSGLSCVTQLASTIHEIMAKVDRRTCIQAVVLDFSKAFDKVPHNKLLKKLIDSGLPLGVIGWVASFLSNRVQRVVLNGSISGPLTVTSGVPQGSVLGPVLFLVYINDIFQAVRHSTVRLYADDALMYFPTGTENDRKFQDDLDNLTNWAIGNQMDFNVKKCHSVFFGEGNHDGSLPEHRLCGVALQRERQFKYLGITVQDNFGWENHVSYVSTKATRSLGLVKHVLCRAPGHVKLIAYKTLTRSILEYGAEVWDPYLKRDINRLENIQNRAIRFICSLKGVCSISSAREGIALETLEERRKKKRKALLCNIVGGRAHPAIQSCFPDLIDNVFFRATPHHTRSFAKSSATAFFCNYSFYLNSFVPRTTRELRLAS